jgi:hypothetical protein
MVEGVLMVNKVLNAITTLLGTNFGTGYRYYVENVEQGLTKPAFHVSFLETFSRSRGTVLYDRTFPMVIHFFTDKKENKITECYKMAEILSELLELISVEGKLVRGRDISWNITDDVLQFFITYEFTTQKITEVGTTMEDLENTSNIHY